MAAKRLQARAIALRASNQSSTRTCLACRSYHSYSDPQQSPYPAAQTAILSSALAHVPTHGFTSTALALGAKDVGYSPISTNLFPRGEFELAMYWMTVARGRLKGRVHGEDGSTGLRRGWEERRIGVGGRVRSLVLERLGMNAQSGIAGRWKEALALMAQPSCIPASLRELGALSDEIWFLAGDQSVDSSWYTKRASLATVYAATEVFQTQDTSPGFKDTERFLDSRLSDLQSVGGSVSAVGEWAGYTAQSVINVLRSRGMRI